MCALRVKHCSCKELLLIQSYFLKVVSLCLYLFICRGSILPYLIAWTLYQGSMITFILNFTGLFVNGFVCFVFPLLLVLRSMEDSNYNYVSIVDSLDDEDETVAEDTVRPLPMSLEPYRRIIVLVLLIIFAVTIILSCILFIRG